MSNTILNDEITPASSNFLDSVWFGKTEITGGSGRKMIRNHDDVTLRYPNGSCRKYRPRLTVEETYVVIETRFSNENNGAPYFEETYQDYKSYLDAVEAAHSKAQIAFRSALDSYLDVPAEAEPEAAPEADPDTCNFYSWSLNRSIPIELQAVIERLDRTHSATICLTRNTLPEKTFHTGLYLYLTESRMSGDYISLHFKTCDAANAFIQAHKAALQGKPVNVHNGNDGIMLNLTL